MGVLKGIQKGSRRGPNGGPEGGPEWGVHVLYRPISDSSLKNCNIPVSCREVTKNLPVIALLK